MPQRRGEERPVDRERAITNSAVVFAEIAAAQVCKHSAIPKLYRWRMSGSRTFAQVTGNKATVTLVARRQRGPAVVCLDYELNWTDGIWTKGICLVTLSQCGPWVRFSLRCRRGKLIVRHLKTSQAS